MANELLNNPAPALRLLARRGQPGRVVPGLVLLCCLVLLQACAGTAKGTKEATYTYNEQLVVADKSRSRADAWVVVRYPAVLEADAETKFVEGFTNNAFGGKLKPEAATGTGPDRVARGLIAKSNYFAMSLYRELVAQLPPDTVLLSPHAIYLDEQGALASRALLETETIPSVLTIDFAAYSFPDPEQMMNAPPLTFGDIVTPIAVVHGDHWLRPATNGLLLASEPLLASAWQQSSELAQEEFEGRLELRHIDDSRDLDLVTALRGSNSVLPDSPNIPVKAPRSPRTEVAAVEVYPLEKIAMDGEIVSRLGSDHSKDPFELSFTQGIGTRMEAVLGQMDHDRATFSDRQKLLAEFDPELAFAFMAQSQDESVRARLQLAEKLIEAERQFLARQSQKIYAGVYEGSYGDAMRELLVLEYNTLEKRRSLARRQNAQTALAILAIAGAAYAGSEAYDGYDYDPTMDFASDLLLISSFVALEASFATKALSGQVGENFVSQMAPALSEQITVQVDLLEGQSEITARNHAELREQTLALYQGAVRSMQVDIRPDCTFRHPDASQQGRWYGACSNGLATGRGYGVVKDDAGYGVEYVGEAERGLATGRGAMILHSPGETGPSYFEGDFKDGLPHGYARAEVPGKGPQLRRFEAGVDKGRAPEGTEVSHVFR